jgi:hypothetical protein
MIWTARLAIACYLMRLWMSAARSGDRPRRVECIFWTAGCALAWAHILFALSIAHEWNLAAAYRHTAQRTAEVTGLNWGGGLYVNFAVAGLWLIDVAVMWRIQGRDAAPSRMWSWGVHAVLAFVILNATLVFGPRGWWWVAGVFGAALTVVLLKRAMRNRLLNQTS